MRYLIFVFFIFSSCSNSVSTNKPPSHDSSTTISNVNASDTNTNSKNIWVDRLNGTKYYLPDTIGDKPVNFYLDNNKVAAIAKAFYKGQFRPTDNDSTTQLLSYVTSNDSIIRPFYRWCLDFTIEITDGALGEYPGVPALAYATKFPNEFFNYMDKDSSGERYKMWIEIIAYSGLNNYNKKEAEIEKDIVSKMLNNCNPCNSKTKSSIAKAAKDIISQLH